MIFGCALSRTAPPAIDIGMMANHLHAMVPATTTVRAILYIVVVTLLATRVTSPDSTIVTVIASSGSAITRHENSGSLRTIVISQDETSLRSVQYPSKLLR